MSNLFRDNVFGGCEETMVTNNCDQYAYSDACSDAWYLYSYPILLFSYIIVEKNGIRIRVFSSLYVDMYVLLTNCLQKSYIYILLPQLINLVWTTKCQYIRHISIFHYAIVLFLNLNIISIAPQRYIQSFIFILLNSALKQESVVFKYSSNIA